ncbi:SseB family protein [Streptomyces tubbatahanensis]|uniref:SseB family protein n=1 Tax=Streptomyces tubbatahanensis TaxID=2923272 RepID=A0ABY3XNR2_9ACTN|nr:SseB family protein [Streptomyces tubbatahanensis]UNS96040.1 SseB family protein [Streptomyces tubbatahanensis]
MALKNIPDSAFSRDDGTADDALAEALAAWRADPRAPDAESRVLQALSGARLLVPVVAVLTEAETGQDGLRRDKTSEMAVPTLNAPGGRRALPAFTSTEALARWRPDARPVAVPLHQALQAAAHEQADTVVLDLAGPVTYELTGPALNALAAGRTHTRPLDDPAVGEAVRAVLAAEPRIAGAHLAPGGSTGDGTLALSLTPGADVQDVARRVAEALAADETVRARVVQGLDLALLPPGSALPENAFYRA